jgi:effector-binding domain-containing protein
MNVAINDNFSVDIYGFSGTAMNKDYVGTAFKLMNKMWELVKQNGLKHKGLNIWVYEPNDSIFAGVELEDASKYYSGLEHKSVSLKKYAYYKHIGPYSSIKQAGQNMKNELKSRGLNTTFPYIEVYGHWTNDESKLETELLMAIK